MSKRRSALALLGFYALCLVIQFAGAAITATTVSDWYPLLNKSTLTPPGYWFGIVWSILYILMAVAGWRVWRIEQKLRTNAQRAWVMQLVTGLIWSLVFFGMKMPNEGLVIIACLWLLVLITFRRFLAIDRLAGLLIAPLLLWVSFATYLQAMIVALN